MRARDLAVRQPVTIPADTTLAEAAALMDGKAVGALLVVDGQRLVGIVTDRDLAIRALARRAPLDGRVDSVMTTGVVSLAPDVDVREALNVLRRHAVRRVPLVEDGRPVGMVTTDDLLIALVGDLSDLVRPIVGEAVFGHPEPRAPAPA
jgi:CBS domain-containing protein